VERRYRVGGMTVEVSGQGQGVEALEKAWKKFLVESPADAQVKVEVDPSRQPAARHVLLPELRAGEGGALLVSSPSFQAEIDAGRKSACVRGAGDRFGVESTLKALLAARLAAKGGMLIHGVALARDGVAALFTGASGAGKSTLGRLGEKAGFTLLADELVAVWAEGQADRAAGTPWNAGSPEEAALRGVGTLARAEEDEAPHLTRQPPSDVLRTLISNVLLPEPSADGRQALFQAEARMLSVVKTWTLWFGKESDVADVLKWALQ